jgi:PAS domain S-box-containing protein
VKICPVEEERQLSMSGSEKNHNQMQSEYPLKYAQIAIDSIDIAIFCTDRVGKVTYANDAAVKLFGYCREEFLELNIGKLDHGMDSPQWQDHWLEIQRKQRLSFEATYWRRDGRPLPVEIRAVYMSDDEEEVYCSFVIDISALNISDRIRQNYELVFRKAMDETSDGVWDRNHRTGEIHYGENWASVLGYTKEDLQCGEISWEKLLHPEDKEQTLQTLRDHISGKTPKYKAEFRLRNSKGDWQWIYARGKIIEYNEEGVPLRFVGTHTDITSRKEMENSLLKRTEETKLFAYSVAHDLKNPALSIHGLVERFSKNLAQLSEDERRLYCDRIIDSSEQIVDLVEKINSYIYSKENIRSFEDIYLKEVVSVSREEFAAQLQFRSIKWHEFQENPIIRMDRVAIIRVFRNLIENALKYGGENLSEIKIGYKDAPDFHIISVKDNGAGMCPEDKEIIFKPFERSRSSAGKHGSGLGLAIVKEIAANHKGEVWVEPGKNNNTTFYFAISKNL